MTSDGETEGQVSGRRTDGERLAIVAETFENGSTVRAVAKRHGVSTASIYLWRREVRDGGLVVARQTLPVATQPPMRSSPPVTLVPVRIASTAEAPTLSRPSYHADSGRIAIRLTNGRALEVCESIDPMKLARLVAALETPAP